MAGLTPAAINAFVAEAYPAATGRCHALGADWALAVQDTTHVALRPGGIIPGPTVFGMADCALWYACFTRIGIEPMALTSELSIRYLRPARGEQLWARATVHHAGGRSVVGSVLVWTDDEAHPAAVAQGTYVRPTDITGDLHHLELWVADIEQSAQAWGWLLGELGFAAGRAWPAEGPIVGRTWNRGRAYVVLEQSPALRGATHDRALPGVNHVAFHAQRRATVDAIVAACAAHGWRLLFAERHPHAGGDAHYAAYLEDGAGHEVEIVGPPE